MNAHVKGRKANGEKSTSNVKGAANETEKANANKAADAIGIVDTQTIAQGSMRALEPRILLDAAMDATFDAVAEDGTIISDAQRQAAQAQADDNEAVVAALSNIQAEGQAKQIAFVDSGVEDADDIIATFGPNIEVVMIEGDSDGVEQIASALDGRKGIEAIHIISHGRSGTLDLGATKFTEASMNGRHADEMAIIRSALSDSADILIYGCDFGAYARGASAVQALADMTGADVAASNDLTGAANLGGDWDLEVEAGSVEAQSIAATHYAHILDDTLDIAELVGGHDGTATSTVTGGDGVTVTISTVSGDNLQNDGVGFGLGMGRQFTGVGVGSNYNVDFNSPQATVSILTSFHNSDGSGNEELRFVVRDTAGNDITSSVTIIYNDQSTVGTTAFGTSPYTGQTALYSSGNAFGVNARGTITFTSTTNEIADIEIEHFRISGTPNGVIIEEVAYGTVAPLDTDNDGVPDVDDVDDDNDGILDTVESNGEFKFDLNDIVIQPPFTVNNSGTDLWNIAQPL